MTPSVSDDGGIAGLTIGVDGVLNVPGDTTQGTYIVIYRICAVAAMALCDTGTVLIRVAQPVAVDDSRAGNPLGTAVMLDVLANDLSSGGPVLDPTSVIIVGASGDGRTLTVADEGTWTVDAATGAITFAPLPAFAGQPTPIQYTVADNLNNRSNPATVVVTYFVPTSIPGLSTWGMLLLGLVIVVLAWRRVLLRAL